MSIILCRAASVTFFIFTFTTLWTIRACRLFSTSSSTIFAQAAGKKSAAFVLKRPMVDVETIKLKNKNADAGKQWHYFQRARYKWSCISSFKSCKPQTRYGQQFRQAQTLD